MAEPITPLSNAGPQPELAGGDEPSGQHSQTPAAWFPSARHVTSGVASPEPLAGSPGHAPAPGQPGELDQAADVTAPGTGALPGRSRRRAVIMIAAAAVVLIASAIGLGVALSSGGSGPAFPGTLLGLARDTSPDAQQLAGQVSSGFSLFQGIIAHPRAAVYDDQSQGVVILTGAWSDAAKADGLVSVTPSAAMGGLKSQGVTGAASFPAGPRGGSLACGDTTIGGQSINICVWLDGKAFGITFYIGSASSLSDAAAKTIQVRSAVEH